MIQWLDYNDCFLAAEWGHLSDNLGSILAVADWLSRTAVAEGKKPLKIHGGLVLENSFNRVGLDHVVLVKVASATVTSKLLGSGYLVVVDWIKVSSRN
ncbi:hypothetical protein PtA15_6A46 [Puccinia triticina]|uniref:MmgE/PrpD N-terminal domain-containing protein n=1 Tax=Puccinia triticina TaxID=208348 RepID=A0ABY7CJL1_9BASI|nr:uncharacterized protein PtA15_6A46 [Puccinia triticina]WAQ85418.1 hypothetical protein PtA15_6A46 [Puccinia triticina]